jgi:hypothetical protein
VEKTMNYQFNVFKQKQITLAVCIPGKTFSREFIICWSDFQAKCFKNNINLVYIFKYSPVVYYARNMCLCGNNSLGKCQFPFNGELKYDYLLWIDSDIIFDFNQFLKLLNRNVPIVSGLYLMSNKIHYATVVNWDEEYFKNNNVFKFSMPKDFENITSLVEVNYTGLGFMLFKFGTLETLTYPWFKPIFYQIDNTYDFCSEDVGLCKSLIAKGHKIYIDPTVIVGHQKEDVLYPK